MASHTSKKGLFDVNDGCKDDVNINFAQIRKHALVSVKCKGMLSNTFKVSLWLQFKNVNDEVLSWFLDNMKLGFPEKQYTTYKLNWKD